MNNTLNIGYVSDDRFAKYLPTHIYGFLKNNTDSVVSIYILTDGISDKHKSDIEKVVQHFKNVKVEFVEINLSIFTDMGIVPFHNSFATYYKLLFEQMLPNIDRLLYLDTDAVVVGNLKELYNIDMGDSYILAANHEQMKQTVDYYLAEVRMPYIRTTPEHYLNAGVILFNFKQIRMDAMGSEKLLEIAANNAGKLVWHDQDVFHLAYENHILFEHKYIALYSFTEGDNRFKKNVKNFNLEPVIIHGTSSNKPWTLPGYTTLGKIWKRDYDGTSKIIGKQEYCQPSRLDLLKQHHWTLALCPRVLMPLVDSIVMKLKQKAN